MKTSFPICSISPALPVCPESGCDSIGLYVSEAPVRAVRRVFVRRRAIRLDARRMAAIRAYRENADLV